MWLRKWRIEILTICGTIFLFILLKPMKIFRCTSPSSYSSLQQATSYLDLHGKFGVNVYGWMKGDFGGGTTARCIVQSLLANNVSISAVTINGAALHSHTNNLISKLKVPQHPKNYLFDLLVINAANTLPILTDASNQVTQNHYRIGLWHWETSTLPDDQGILGGYYDEIWAPSEYVANAILSTPSFPSTVRISIVPYGYETLSELVTTQARSLARSQLLTCIPSLKTSRSSNWNSNFNSQNNNNNNNKMDLICTSCSKYTMENMLLWSQSHSSSSRYITLFLVIFDFNSDFQRKNILGIISAFHSAFPNSGDSQYTGLIIKSSNGQHQPNDYSTLLTTLDNSDDLSRRIVFMDGVLSSSALITLKRSVDCYVSLHRSEGWGLNILESVLMGIPVIHTSFGGSEQFMKPLYEHILPELRIPFELINITRPFGPYTTSMQWAEPSHGAAVHAFTQVHTSLFRYHSYSKLIRSEAIRLLSPSSTGLVMIQRLQQIAFCLCHISETIPHFSPLSFPFSSSSSSSSTCDSIMTQQNKQSFYEEMRIQLSADGEESSGHLTSSSHLHPHPHPQSQSQSQSSKSDPNRSHLKPEGIISFCHKNILGKRILKEKYKRLK